MRVNVIYDLTNPTDAHAYRCSQKAVEAFYTLESIADDIDVWLASKMTSEGALVDIHRIILEWKRSNV